MTTEATTQTTNLQTPPRTLAKATAGAVLAAGAILTLFVLPAEMGIDPTGAGHALGLTAMAQTPEAGEPQATAVATLSAVPSKQTIAKVPALRSDTMTITLAPHSGQEVKAHMQAGDSFVFAWQSEGGPVKVDMHGEKTDAGDGEFTSYWEEKQLSEARGTFTAPFEGTHGWYWRNKGETAIKVTVRTTGFYKDLFKPGEKI